MTRKHYQSIAWELRLAHPSTTDLDPASDGYFWREKQWQTDCVAIARVLAADNGRFDYGRFYRAAGFELRPDGSMFPMVAPR